MTGGIYDHLLIIGTVCSFIQGMSNAWLLNNLLIPTLLVDFTEVQPENLRVRGNLQTGFSRPGPERDS